MIVNVDNLTKRYGSLTAVDNLSLKISEGEIFGLLGPNGSGKTTAINCILSLLKYDRGEITIFGRKMSPKAYDIKKDIGIVMQNVAVFNELTVYENINYFCGLYVKDKEKRKKLVDEAVKFTGLEDFVKFYPKKLSGGLLRRLNIACGIAHKPKLIILDEPTVAVDPQSRNSILEGIQGLNKAGATIIYTTHYMEEVEQICTRIAIIDKGKIIALGTKEELKAMIGVHEKISVELPGSDREEIKCLAKGIEDMSVVDKVYINEKYLHIKSAKGKHALSSILYYLQEQNAAVGNVTSKEPTLNDVFLEITGKELRDNV
ncbi:MAG: ATP-binding cassette domain-containing protein [Lachnospiraceae bacterium]